MGGGRRLKADVAHEEDVEIDCVRFEGEVHGRQVYIHLHIQPITLVCFHLFSFCIIIVSKRVSVLGGVIATWGPSRQITFTVT